MAGRPWVGIPWLADLLFYAVQAHLGFAGLVALKLAVGLATLLLLAEAATLAGASASAARAILPLAAVLLQSRLTRIRPEMLGLGLMALWALLLVRALRGSRASLVGLVLVGLGWCATHTSVVLAGGVALGSVAVALLRRLQVRAAVSTLAAVLVALSPLLLTEYGHGVLHAIRMSNRVASPLIYALTSEWRPPGLGASWLVPGALTLAAFALRGRALLAFPPLLVGPLAGAILSAQAERHTAFWAVMAAPAWALALDAGAASIRSRARAWVASLATASCALALPLAVLGLTPFERNRIAFGFGIVRERYPYEALDLLARLPPARLINELEDGGFLIWHRIPVFIDGRTVHLYTDADVAALLLPARAGDEAIDALADRFGIVYALGSLDASWGSPLMASPRWVPLQHGKHATLFVRRALLATVLARGAHPFAWLRFVPDDRWLERWYAPILRDPERRRLLVEEVKRSWAESPDNPVVRGLLVFLAGADPALLEQLRAAL